MTDYTETTLFFFRIAGTRSPLHELNDVLGSWENWHSGSLKNTITAFSPTVYSVLHTHENGERSILTGSLVSTDVLLPAIAQELLLPPQNYRVYTLSENHPSALSPLWDTLQLADTPCFAAFPLSGSAKLYIPCGGTVESGEEILDGLSE